MSTEIINKKHTRVDEVIEFEVKDNLVAFSIECSSERSNTLNFMIYTDCDEIQGQHFSRVESTKIFIGFERANTSLYSLPLKKSSKYYITDFNTSDYMKNNFAETDMVIKLFYDKDLYQEYFSANFVNLDESEELIHFMKESSDDIELTEYDEEKIYQDEERWYVGDLHTHTIFSDGNLRREENIRDAKSQGLDFFFATDHNILPLNWPKSEEILVVPAEEITTEFGHFNLYFAKRNPLEKENIMKISDKEKVKEIIDYAKNYGILSINHPFSDDDFVKIDDLDLRNFTSIEIINDPFEHPYDKTFNQALKAWSCIWNMGVDLSGNAGSDVHFSENREKKNKSIGFPRNYILSKNLSAKEIKKAYLNKAITFSMKDRCDLYFTEDDVNGEVKGNNAAGVYIERDKVSLLASYHGVEEAVIEWIVDGEIVDYVVGKSDSRVFEDCSWIRADFRTKDYKYIGSTNPVRIRKAKEITGKTWSDVISAMNPEIKVVVFDKDGTLIEFSDMWLHSTRQYLQSIQMEDEERIKCELALGIDGDSFLDNSILSKGTVNEAFRKIAEFKSVIPATEEGFEDAMIDYIDQHKDVIIERSDLKFVFENLTERAIKIAVLSNDNLKLINKALEILGLEDYVEMVIGADTSVAKPSPRSFIDLRKHFGVKGNEMVYVGDSNVDLLHGNYYGKFIAFPSSVSDRETLERYSDFVINDLKELLEIL